MQTRDGERIGKTPHAASSLRIASDCARLSCLRYRHESNCVSGRRQLRCTCRYPETCKLGRGKKILCPPLPGSATCGFQFCHLGPHQRFLRQCLALDIHPQSIKWVVPGCLGRCAQSFSRHVAQLHLHRPAVVSFKETREPLIESVGSETKNVFDPPREPYCYTRMSG